MNGDDRVAHPGQVEVRRCRTRYPCRTRRGARTPAAAAGRTSGRGLDVAEVGLLDPLVAAQRLGVVLRGRSRPRLSTMASSATSSARLTCCSTRTMAASWSVAIWRTVPNSCSTTSGARPMLISSTSSTLGSWIRARAMHEHLLLAAREGAGAAPSSASRAPGRCRAGRVGDGPPRRLGDLEVLLDGEGGEQAAVVGHQHHAGLGWRGWAGRCGAASPSIDDGAVVRGQQPGQGEQQRGLAGAVRAEQGEHLAGLRRRGRGRGTTVDRGRGRR